MRDRAKKVVFDKWANDGFYSGCYAGKKKRAI
jgi:hypothetical protein